MENVAINIVHDSLERAPTMKKLLIIFKDHRLLKLSFILLTVYLLFDELVLFFYTKPTLTTKVQTSLQTNQFPEALICSSPAFDQEKLISMGYEHSHDYILGILTENSFMAGLVTNLMSALKRFFKIFLS